MKFQFASHSLSLEELEGHREYRALKAPVIACGEGLPQADTGYVFGSEDELLAWGARLPIKNTLKELHGRIEKARSLRGQDTKAALERQKVLAARLTEDLRALAKRMGLAPNSKELLLRATVNADPLEGCYFDAAVLYAGAGFTGTAVGTIAPLATLAPWGLDNAVSSVQVVGACGLFSGTFFGGTSRWLFGVPYFQIANLGTIGFNNVTSSAYAYYL